MSKKSVDLSVLIDVEERIVRGQTKHKIVKDLMAEHGISQSTGYKWIQKVFDAWAQDARPEYRETRRDYIRGRLREQYRLATNRTKVVVVDGKKYEKPDPDVRGAAAVLSLEADLDGLRKTTLEHDAGDGAAKLMRDMQIKYDRMQRAKVDPGSGGDD